MEDGLDKKGDNKDFEEKLAEQLFADESTAKVQVCHFLLLLLLFEDITCYDAITVLFPCQPWL